MNHFKGKEPLQHVIDARMKGKMASEEVHGAEIPGHLNAAADAAKETAFILLLLGNASLPFLAAYALWKTGRSAILGWSRLERLHRVIEEERYEIEHHRPQEKEELKALYAAKGFSGKMLDEVVEVLMADDNRLLQVMLEEELGLDLQTCEHPLKQAVGALLGVIGASLILLFPPSVLPFSASIIVLISATATAKLQKNAVLPAIVWNLAILALAVGAAHFLSQIL